MISIKVSDEDISFAKQQIADFEKISSWRYSDVQAWRGIVCEMLTSRWLEQNFHVQERAKGLDTTGIVDEYDMLVNGKKVEIKSATKNYFKYIMPKIHDKPKDIYIGARYNETIHPNEVQILGSITHSKVIKYPIKQNKGSPYYEVPIADLVPIGGGLDRFIGE